MIDLIKNLELPMLIDGGIHTDERGEITFINDAHLQGVRRFYMVSNASTGVIRAWQGHQRESKIFCVLQGSFLVAAVRIDNFENPADDLDVEHFILQADTPQALFLPPGYANGMKALTETNQLLVFSDMDIQASAADTYRYPHDRWFDWEAYGS